MNTESYIIDQLRKFLEHKKLTGFNIILQKPKDDAHGDYACNLAMQLAGSLKKSPKQIAEEIISFIDINPEYIAKVEVAGPGFLNFFRAEENLYKSLQDLLAAGDTYGYSQKMGGKKAQIEFVSANPTGPLTIGHGRGAVFGDTIARLMEAIGYKVIREYYFNNAGRQMRVLGDSVRLRYLELTGDKIQFPEDYYQGEYIIDIAREIYAEYGERLRHEQDITLFKDKAETAIFSDIKNTIRRLGFEFDVFYNERSLYETGKIDAVIDSLTKKGLLEKRDGAFWFLSSKIGFDQDRVFIKSSGEPTYRLPDTAYHIEKIKTGYDLIIDIFGADHIATYPDVLAAVKALGYDTEKIKVLINQFVTLTENGEKVKMSTRKANFITLDELMDEVGVDVTRYFFLMRNINAHLNFDLTLAKTQSDENPVFYIQYAHARICSILRLAEERNVDKSVERRLDMLKENEEINLIKHLISFPAAVESSALSFEPHRLINYLFDLATLFHRFYTVCRVISDDKMLSISRLALIDAVKIIIHNGLHLLGINAPEKM
ncbi:MAG: arginine--tRNA ligase [Calditrichaceae bacterium]|nr:arginine--tRNA ligase [Calditrichaceae bacterium]RQV97851.1 MAG: arginine--tRNA ligase [Calditrichota bacterium]